MSHDVEVEVFYRNIKLSDRALLEAKDESKAFVSLESPMPVGTTVSLKAAHAPEKTVAARVVAVSEPLKRGLTGEVTQPGMELTLEAGEQWWEGILDDVTGDLYTDGDETPVRKVPDLVEKISGEYDKVADAAQDASAEAAESSKE